MIHRIRCAALPAVFCFGLVGVASIPPAQAGSIVAWGSDANGQVSNTPMGDDFIAVAGGGDTAFALRSDGSIAGWGYDGNGLISNAPTGTGFLAIATGDDFGVALRDDGPAAVPEPSSLAMSGIAAAALAGAAMRRRSRRGA